MSGIPTELLFDLPAAMLDSRKIEQRIQPYSQSQYSQAGQVAKFTIPQTDRTLAYGQTMYLTGQVDISSVGITDASGNPASGFTYAVLGSNYSMFSRQVVNANGQVLETIERPGELVNLLMNMTMNNSERMSQMNSMGTNTQKTDGDYLLDGSTNLGSFIINSTASPSVGSNANRTYTFSIPIIGIFDANKYIPMWNSNIDLELTINALTNWLIVIGSGGGFPAGFTLTNLELVFDSIELTPESYNVIMANYPQQLRIKTQTYLSGTAPMTQNSGAQDLQINARLASMKQLFFYFNQANCIDKSFGGVNPNGNDVVFITNGQYYPQRPIKLTNPSEVYMQQQKAFGSIKTYSHSGCIGKGELCVRNVNNSLYNAPFVSGNTTNSVSSALYYGNKFYLAIDTEKINTNKTTIYNGIPTGVNSNIRLNISDTLTQAFSCYYWCCYDVLLNMDFTTGITTAIY